MKKQQYRYFLIPVCFGLFILSACCQPAQKNSYPSVIDSSFSDSAIKDAIEIPNVDTPFNPLDSGYYPVYSLNIKNTGAEADTFYLSYSRIRNGFLEPLTSQQYVQAGETKTFKTIGPLPSNSLDSLKVLLYSFFVKTTDSIALSIMQPQVTIHYGQTPNGPEQCGSTGVTIPVDITKLKHN